MQQLATVKRGQRPSGVAGSKRETASGCKMRANWGNFGDSACETLSSVFLSQPQSGHSSCGVCCPMNFPKASSLRLPKMLLNGSPFHSPVELLIAFSSRKAAQLNQQEAFGQRKGAGKCLHHRGRCFSFLT